MAVEPRCAIFSTGRFVVRKLMLVVAGAVVAGSAILGTGAGSADPTSGNLFNVVGEPYAKAVAILRAQGVKTTFGGSVGSDVPQAQCIVSSQKVLTMAKMTLMLDCTAAAQPEAPSAPSTGTGTSGSGTSGSQDSGAAGRPTPGAPGVVTVVPTQVG